MALLKVRQPDDTWVEIVPGGASPDQASMLAAHDAAIDANTAAIARVDPGENGTDGKLLGWVGTPGAPDWVDPPEGGGLTEDQEAIIDRTESREYDIRAWGTPTGTATDVTFINQAISDIHDGGGGTLHFPRVATGYGVARIDDEQFSGIHPLPRVSMHSHGADFHMRDNCTFFLAKSQEEAREVITADVAAGATDITVDDGTAFSVGKPVMLRLNTNPVDTPEPQDIHFATITGIAGDVLTIDQPVSVAVSVSGTPDTRGREVIQFTEILENVSFSGTWNLINDMASGANSEQGFYFLYARNITIGTVVATNPGAGAVTAAFCQNIATDKIHIVEGVAQAGQSSKGRAFGCSNTTGFHIGSALVERSDGPALCYFESYTRDARVGHLHVINSEVDRDDDDKYAIYCGQGVQARFDYVKLSGLPQRGMVGSRDNLSVRHLDLQMSSVPVAGWTDMGVVTDHVTISKLEYGPRRKINKVFPITASMSNVSGPTVGQGVMAGFTLQVSTTTGWTEWYYSGTGGTINLPSAAHTAGVPRRASTSSGWGSDGAYAPNNPLYTKTIYLYSDGTVPADQWGVATFDYFPLSSENPSQLTDDWSEILKLTGVIA